MGYKCHAHCVTALLQGPTWLHITSAFMKESPSVVILFFPFMSLPLLSNQVNSQQFALPLPSSNFSIVMKIFLLGTVLPVGMLLYPLRCRFSLLGKVK